MERGVVLVHGAWHGAGAWERVLPWLMSAGGEGVALDLPGHGQDDGPLGDGRHRRQVAPRRARGGSVWLPQVCGGATRRTTRKLPQAPSSTNSPEASAAQ